MTTWAFNGNEDHNINGQCSVKYGLSQGETKDCGCNVGDFNGPSSTSKRSPGGLEATCSRGGRPHCPCVVDASLSHTGVSKDNVIRVFTLFLSSVRLAAWGEPKASSLSCCFKPGRHPQIHFVFYFYFQMTLETTRSSFSTSRSPQPFVKTTLKSATMIGARIGAAPGRYIDDSRPTYSVELCFHMNVYGDIDFIDFLKRYMSCDRLCGVAIKHRTL